MPEPQRRDLESAATGPGPRDFGERTEFYTFAPESLATLLPEYELLREVGKGSMGIVYEARRRRDGLRVAVKVLPPSLTLTERALARFLREGELMRRVEHEGIAKVFDLGQSGRISWFAMEFVDGTELGARLAVGPLPIRQVAQIGAEVARALHFAHERGIVHRDVKPQNLILRPNGRTVITDFGLARETGTGSMTESGAIVGTPMFMAPEQVLGDRGAVGARSDVYGLGATLYALVTGRPPFDGPSAQSVLKQVLDARPKRASALRTELPRDLEAVLQKAMEREPARRYGTAAELADDLEAFLAGRRTAARLPGPGRAALHWAAERRVPVSLSAVILLLGLGSWLLFRDRERSAQETALAEAERTLALASGVFDELGRRLSEEERESLLFGAVAKASDVIASDAEFARAWFVRAKARHQLRRWSEAVDDLDAAERLAGDTSPDLLLYRIDALSHLYDQRSREALRVDLQRLLDLDPSPRNRCIVAGHMVTMADRIATPERGELLDAAEGVIGEEEPRDTHDFVVRARLLELRGDREASRRTILEATHRFPGDALAHAAAAELLRRLGFGAEGDVAAETARRIDPRVESAPAMESTPTEPGIDVLELQDFVDGVRGLVQRIEKKDE